MAGRLALADDRLHEIGLQPDRRAELGCDLSAFEIQRHAREAHGMALSHDDALLLAFRAQLNADSPSTITQSRPPELRRRSDEVENGS
jgi:hypothetical protein